MTGIALRVEELSKCYRIYQHPRDRLIQSIWGRDRRGKPKQYYKEFWALQKLSFELKKGETLGIVGRNGSGKSTLLQLICGTLQASTGSIQVGGRIGALLELGSGFNPEFTGLENIFFNASLLGLRTKETEAKLDQILDFADIGNYINQPVKSYSSGMAMRLAFAVQAHIDPDLLVVDEALAVGDEFFQKKCYAHLEQLKERGTSILLVTHSCPQIIQHCDQALLLHKGKACMLSEAAKVTVTYQRLINASDEAWKQEFEKEPKQPATETDERTIEALPTKGIAGEVPERPSDQAWLDPSLIPQTTDIYPCHGAEIEDVWISDQDGSKVNTLHFGQAFTIHFDCHARVNLSTVAMACHIANNTGLRITGQTYPAAISAKEGQHIETIRAGSRWTASYSFHGGLWPGVYFIGGGIMSFESGSSEFLHRVVDYKAIRILDDGSSTVVGSSSLQSEEPQIRGLG